LKNLITDRIITKKEEGKKDHRPLKEAGIISGSIYEIVIK